MIMIMKFSGKGVKIFIWEKVEGWFKNGRLTRPEAEAYDQHLKWLSPYLDI